MFVELKILIHLHDNDIIIHKISVKREISKYLRVKRYFYQILSVIA
jgi:hypothetical protein